MKTIYKITLTFTEDNKSKEIYAVAAKTGSLSKIWGYHKDKYLIATSGQFIYLYDQMKLNTLNKFKITKLVDCTTNDQKEIDKMVFTYMTNLNTFFPNGMNLASNRITNKVSSDVIELSQNEYLIYKICGPTNSNTKNYIGSAKQQLNEIWGKHKFNYNKVESTEYGCLYNAMQIFGIDNFKITYVTKCNFNNLRDLIKNIITDNDAFYPNGYNDLQSLDINLNKKTLGLSNATDNYIDSLDFNKININYTSDASIYVIEGPVSSFKNCKKYVGQTTKSIEERFNGHKKETTSMYPLHKAIQLYGSTDFKVSLLEKCEYINLDARETHYISILNVLQPNGYNIRKGTRADYIETILDIDLFNESMPKYISYFQYIDTNTRERIKRHGFNIYHNPSGRRKTITVLITDKITQQMLIDAEKYLSIIITEYNSK